jgi:protein-S-isoprenylcysteine O-methyltransferase Ste14
VTRAPAGPRLLAWFGATLFATSLLYFLFSYAVTFREITPGRPDAAVIARNVALFVAFAGHHSLFARTWLRAWVARAVSPSLERTVYVVIASLMLIGVCLLWQPVPGVAWQARPPLSWLLPVAQVAGVWLTLRSAAIIDIWDLAGVRQTTTSNLKLQTPNPSQEPLEFGIGGLEFKTEGPYGWVRHPIYLGWFLLVLPVATMTMTRLVFAAVSCAYVLIAIPLEERGLRRATGGAYGEYVRKVPWKLVPYVY